MAAGFRASGESAKQRGFAAAAGAGDEEDGAGLQVAIKGGGNGSEVWRARSAEIVDAETEWPDGAEDAIGERSG